MDETGGLSPVGIMNTTSVTSQKSASPPRVGSTVTPRSSTSRKNGQRITKQYHRYRETCQTESVSKSFKSASGTVANTKELNFRTTTFFDWDNPTASGTPVARYIWSRAQASLSNQGLLKSNVLSRLKSVRVWVLPRAQNALVADTAYAVLFGVPVVDAESTKSLTATRNTVVKPDFNIQWILAGEYGPEIFDDNMALPDTSGDEQCIFEMTCVNIDDGSALVDESVQVAVEINYAQPLPVEATTKVAVAKAASFEGKLFTAAENQFGMVELTHLSNSN